MVALWGISAAQRQKDHLLSFPQSFRRADVFFWEVLPAGPMKGLLDVALILLDTAQYYPVAEIFLGSSWG